jgi:hypothetical protein
MALIAAFVVPKISFSGGEAERKVKFKQTIIHMRNALKEAESTGQVAQAYGSSSYYSPFSDKLQGVQRFCSGCISDGCNTEAGSGSGFVMENGVTVCDFNMNVGVNEGITLDSNGAEGPNTQGADQITLRLQISGPNEKVRWGFHSSMADSEALYNTLWE